MDSKEILFLTVLKVICNDVKLIQSEQFRTTKSKLRAERDFKKQCIGGTFQHPFWSMFMASGREDYMLNTLQSFWVVLSGM